jgi:hypothetical protein
MSNELVGKIDFCMSCKRLVDYSLTTIHRHQLYIQINEEVEAPNNRVAIPVCENCQAMLMEHLPGIDGFIVEIPQ